MASRNMRRAGCSNATEDPEGKKVEWRAIAGFAFAVLGLAFFLLLFWRYYLFLLLELLGLILSGLALRNMRKQPGMWKGKVFATIGWYIGIAFFSFGIFFIIFGVISS